METPHLLIHNEIPVSHKRRLYQREITLYIFVCKIRLLSAEYASVHLLIKLYFNFSHFIIFINFVWCTYNVYMLTHAERKKKFGIVLQFLSIFFFCILKSFGYSTQYSIRNNKDFYHFEYCFFFSSFIIFIIFFQRYHKFSGGTIKKKKRTVTQKKLKIIK